MKKEALVVNVIGILFIIGSLFSFASILFLSLGEDPVRYFTAYAGTPDYRGMAGLMAAVTALHFFMGLYQGAAGFTLLKRIPAGWPLTMAIALGGILTGLWTSWTSIGGLVDAAVMGGVVIVLMWAPVRRLFLGDEERLPVRTTAVMLVFLGVFSVFFYFLKDQSVPAGMERLAARETDLTAVLAQNQEGLDPDLLRQGVAWPSPPGWDRVGEGVLRSPDRKALIMVRAVPIPRHDPFLIWALRQGFFRMFFLPGEEVARSYDGTFRQSWSFVKNVPGASGVRGRHYAFLKFGKGLPRSVEITLLASPEAFEQYLPDLEKGINNFGMF